jgi:hypothetical protein
MLLDVLSDAVVLRMRNCDRSALSIGARNRRPPLIGPGPLLNGFTNVTVALRPVLAST